MSILRTLDRRDTMPDTLMIYSSPNEERMIFRDELSALHEKHSSLTVIQRFTDEEGMFELDQLEEVCPDWQERGTWACGPTPMLDAAVEFWEEAGRREEAASRALLHSSWASDAEGGTITFANSGKKVEVDGATTLLEAGEEAGVGHALRLPHRHLPHLHADHGVREDQGPAQRRGAQRRRTRTSRPASPPPAAT